MPDRAGARPGARPYHLQCGSRPYRVRRRKVCLGRPAEQSLENSLTRVGEQSLETSLTLKIALQ